MRWEYCHHQVMSEPMGLICHGQERLHVFQLLKKLGDEGWEMCGCVTTQDETPDFYKGHVLYFKRPKANG